MNKKEFLQELEACLSGLPQEDAEERLAFYGEMIDDRIEEGLSEEAAVAGVGSVADIVSQTVAEIPLAKLVKEKMAPKRSLRGWEIVLIVLGFPLWFPLLAAAAAIVLALYVTVWALIVSLWAVEVSLWACALAGLAAAVAYFVWGFRLQGLAFLGAGLFCAGVSIFMFFACAAASEGILRLTKKAALGIKSKFLGKERTK